MLLNSEELLALVNGDVEPDRLADLLDRLEHCSESADALQVLVALRANREEALNALHEAQERDVAAYASVTPHPATFPQTPPVDWATQGLRLAATVAIVAVISVWAASSYLGVGHSTDTSQLATTTFDNIIELSTDTVLTANNSTQIGLAEAHAALDSGNYAEAKQILSGDLLLRSAPEGLLYLGMSHYFLNEYDEAVNRFDELRGRIENGEDIASGVEHQAAWYLANALLALDRQMSAMDVLEEVRAAHGYRFQPRAAELYAQVREAVGLTSPNEPRD